MVAEHEIVNVEARVYSVVRETLAIDAESLDPDAALEEDLGVDSLDLVSLIMALEDEFGGSISEDEARKLKTLRDVVSYISDRLKSTRLTT